MFFVKSLLMVSMVGLSATVFSAASKTIESGSNGQQKVSNKPKKIKASEDPWYCKSVSPTSCSMYVTPRRLSKVSFDVSEDATGGLKINFSDTAGKNLKNIAQIDRLEEAMAFLQFDDKNKHSRTCVVVLGQDIQKALAAKVRVHNDTLDAEGLAHTFTAELFIEVLRHGSTYVQVRTDEDNEPCLLVVASVTRTLDGDITKLLDVNDAHFITLCFELNDGVIGKCFHCCTQAKHPKDVQNDQGDQKYLLAGIPVDCFMKNNGGIELKVDKEKLKRIVRSLKDRLDRLRNSDEILLN